ncbi:MAG: aminopeptidase P N-terminal domain-containing protein [Bdellovibrionota bacterium]
MIPRHHSLKTFESRRKTLADALTPDLDLLIYFNTAEKIRNHDTEYSYRGDSSFLYMTGFPESGSAFTLSREKGQKSGAKSVFKIFTLEKNAQKEQWTGLRYGPQGAVKTFGATNAYVNTELKTQFLEWMKSRPKGAPVRILTNALHDPELRSELYALLDSYVGRSRLGAAQIVAIEDIGPFIQTMRLIKDAEEMKTMRYSARIAADAHLKALGALRPGIYEYEIQAVIESEFLRQGASGVSYNSIVASGTNATILHYNSNNRLMKDGELLLIDAGCEYHSYASDITRTFPVGGRFSVAQRNIMDIVADAHQEAILVSRAGTAYPKVHEAATNALIDGLRTLKLLKGPKKEILKTDAHRRYYPHGTGHWLGLDVHDNSPYVDAKGAPLRLKPNMVFTVEPGLYFLPNDKTVPAEYRGIGVRIEDDVVVKAKGSAEIITTKLPRYAAEIESFMSGTKR